MEHFNHSSTFRSIVIPLCLLITLLPESRVALADEAIVWNVSSDQPSDFSSMLTSSGSKVRISFVSPQHIISQNTSVQVIRELPEIPLSVSSGTSGEGTDDPAGILDANDKINHCESLGLGADCSVTYALKEFNLGAGDSVEFKAKFTEKINDQEKTYVRTARFSLAPRGTFRLGVGTLFIPSEDTFLTRPIDDEYEIHETSGSGFSLQLAATVTWVPYSAQIGNNWSFGPTLGLGTDADNLSVFLGYSTIFRRAWTLTVGAAAVKQADLNEIYSVGERVPDPIDSSMLTTESYEIRPFVGLTWSPADSQ